jgi:iron-sulfur cluster assembly accessory protein
MTYCTNPSYKYSGKLKKFTHSYEYQVDDGSMSAFLIYLFISHLRQLRQQSDSVICCVRRKIQVSWGYVLVLLESTYRKYSNLHSTTASRGCENLSYTMDYTKAREKFDEVVDAEGVKVFVDSKAVMYLIGTEMDYISNDLQQEFVFNNPNTKSSCGCGKSFSV